MIFYCIFELTEAFTTRLHQKNVQKPSKKAKNTAAGTNILPKKVKVLLFFPSPPHSRKLALYTQVVMMLVKVAFRKDTGLADVNENYSKDTPHDKERK